VSVKKREAEGQAFCLDFRLRRCQFHRRMNAEGTPVTWLVSAAAAADRRRIAKHPAKVLML
jgi:hypothetical protein